MLNRFPVAILLLGTLLNGQDSNIIVGIDIGSSKICCVIGKISDQDNKIKLLGCVAQR